MNHYRVRNISKTLTIPAGSNSITDALLEDLNGLLRWISIVPPTALTGSSYSVNVLGRNGENMFTKATLAANTTAVINEDGNSNNLIVPICSQAGQNWLSIVVAGDTAAQGILTSNNTNVSDGDTVTIGSVVYRFKTVPAQAYDIFIGGSADLSLTNLADAINGTGTAGTNWFAGTVAHPLVTSSAVASHALTITANSETIAGDSIATTKVATTLSWGNTTLTGSGEASNRAFAIDAYIEE